MISNWLLLGVVLLLGGAFVLIFGRDHANQKARSVRSRLMVNRELYQQRIEELEQEVADGVLSEDAKAEALAELDKRFVTENEALEQEIQQQQPAKLGWVALLVIVIAGGVYLSSQSWRLQLQADEALQALPELGKRALQDDSQQLSENELDIFALGLRQKLAQQPDDAVAWLVYGRVMLAQGQLEQAIAAMQKSYDLNPERLGTLLSYSQLLLSTGDDQYLGRAARMLAAALEQSPGNIDALSLLGFVAYERQDWEQAVAAWQLLLNQIDSSDHRYAVIENALNDAKQRSKTSANALQVTVELAADLQAAIPADATLFVFVRAPGQGGMPAAVVKQAVSNFPVIVTLSDADAMLPDVRMSQLEQWQVFARISADENIDASPGDLDGRSRVLENQANQEISLTIDTRLPETGTE